MWSVGPGNHLFHGHVAGEDLGVHMLPVQFVWLGSVHCLAQLGGRDSAHWWRVEICIPLAQPCGGGPHAAGVHVLLVLPGDWGLCATDKAHVVMKIPGVIMPKLDSPPQGNAVAITLVLLVSYGLAQTIWFSHFSCVFLFVVTICTVQMMTLVNSL